MRSASYRGNGYSGGSTGSGSDRPRNRRLRGLLDAHSVDRSMLLCGVQADHRAVSVEVRRARSEWLSINGQTRFSSELTVAGVAHRRGAERARSEQVSKEGHSKTDTISLAKEKEKRRK